MVVFGRSSRYIGHISDTDFFRHGKKSARQQIGHTRGALAAQGPGQAVLEADRAGAASWLPAARRPPGTWTVRRYVGGQDYTVATLKGVIADDHAEADGTTVLSFAQAQRAVQAYKPNAGPLTVRGAVEQYLAHLTDIGKSTDHRAIALTR